jgi:hypothetical protein
VLIGPLGWIHILAGPLALIVAPGAMLTVKGGRAHRRWGRSTSGSWRSWP